MLRAAGDSLVQDERGDRCYVAINPGYAAPPAAYTRVLAVRSLVGFLAFVGTLLSAVGQAVYFRRGAYGMSKYGVWRSFQFPGCWINDLDPEASKMRKVFAVATSVFGLISCILSTVYAVEWPTLERARRAEQEDNFQLLCTYATGLNDAEDSSATSFPFVNARVENRGHVEKVPIEEVERRRRKKDNDVGIAIFSMTMMAAVSAIITVLLMLYFHDSDFYCDGYQSEWDAGFGLFIASLALSVTAFILVAIPQLTDLYLCRLPPVVRCQLMLVDVHRALQQQPPPGASTAQYRSYTNAGLPVALPGPHRSLLRHASPPPAGELSAEVSPGRGQLPEAEQEDNYTTAAYYTAPPPLFRMVHSDAPPH
ncbi:hypothetical protein ABB37_06756 [Leptomonas pyrrhocoris]|uniref:Uncharacterized protein n=1 Tax=Leptomonas pyrrhocoris TaxID=157538 RepID=A0A0N0DTU7_LEPPY|nr:hypothetical protein ABB37_06756 [Leptomonas pyrrhocoris]KPA77991.1 hypothetical protein ABB37_06756 [Leptomonas pyrrhocoris]|eukprot:XP_015656430.1 hypothetical protein ABB37_06756 [Leptomonas pyrrhocoris]